MQDKRCMHVLLLNRLYVLTANWCLIVFIFVFLPFTLFSQFFTIRHFSRMKTEVTWKRERECVKYWFLLSVRCIHLDLTAPTLKKKSLVFMMAHSTWHIQFTSRTTIVFLLIYFVSSIFLLDNVSAQIESQPWYEALPAVAMDYKVHLPAGKEDCYYQYVQQGATLYVSFQVIHSTSLCTLYLPQLCHCVCIIVCDYYAHIPGEREKNTRQCLLFHCDRCCQCCNSFNWPMKRATGQWLERNRSRCGPYTFIRYKITLDAVIVCLFLF